MKILHVLYTYFPDVTGSTIRSEGIVSSQKKNGNEVTVITSPFQQGNSDDKVEFINGIEVHRTYNEGRKLSISEERVSLLKRLKKIFYVFPFTSAIYKLSKEKKIDVIHAHSMFFCAYPSYVAAKLLKVPFVYEFRSVWEERFNNRLQNKLIKKLETWALKLADSVVVINNGLKDELVGRGVKEEKISVVPNAISNSVIELSTNFEAPKEINSFGYIGNFSEIEGLDILINAFSDAFPKDASNANKYTLHFNGRGPFEAKLNKLISDKNDPRIVNYGSFTRDELVKVYQSVDAVVIPRLNLKICNTVTPLKPLEAMAFRRLFMGSSVGGIVEVCGGESNNNGMFFKPESVSSLSKLMRSTTEELNKNIIVNGANYAHTVRTWDNISSFYVKAYDYAKHGVCK
ncbi:glycosyltransferase family 4 protein [Pseudoalteromonas sp. SaAl2]